MADVTDKAEFLHKLANLFDKYGAGMYYTNDDDGIHVTIDGKDVAVVCDSGPADELRIAASAFTK